MKIIAYIPLLLFLLGLFIINGCETEKSNKDKSSISIGYHVQSEGSATITPHELTAGKFETFTIEYTVGPGGIAEGGALWIDDPDFNGMGWSMFQNFQVNNPHESGYVSAKIIGVSKITLKLARVSPSSNQRRHYVIVTLKDTQLTAGDKITVVYSNLSFSSSKVDRLRARAYKNVAFNIYVDSNGNGVFHPIEKSPVINIKSSKPSKIVITGTSFVKIGQTFETTVRILDQYGNPAEDYSGTVSFPSTDPDAVLPKPYTFSPADKGVHVFKQNRMNTKGIHYITVKDSAGQFEDESNPIATVEATPEYKLYWGDLHGHHGQIFYEEGKLKNQYYNYAKDVSDLDFTSETAKSSTYWNVKDTWIEVSEAAFLYNTPGEFITFLGFEWMGKKGQGHHDIYYRYDHQPYYSPDSESSDTLPELWNLLSNKDAITIPHATIYTGFNWADQNNKLRPLVEIYSEWGSSEENRIRSIRESKGLMAYFKMLVKKVLYMGKLGSVQQGLNNGNKMGFIACSDTHMGQPGGTQRGLYAVGGLTAVYAKDLNRSDLWESFLKRRTYGTTGVRILLNFEVNGHMMGEEFKTSSDPAVKVKVAGTDTIQKIDIIKCNYTNRKKCFISYSKSPNKRKTSFSWIDRDFKEDCFYYVRVIQEDGNMAWSSPIWVDQH